ncbi:bifunctional aminoglycoside phosphotransferase/ATP-binding protein [Janthinobacterium sp. 17J80-10]|uniref:bifunctional aminoglycoside phosphotransferase/ATP-binding protein n=1 Tax=Janthinobacterium sp. 17J80-10 TaxID=2497863 RepID=UPI0013E8BF29|nr:bifunctional aminoglycoside phosphotransferase/ATP-binding protein [Janthinobacterium sp. 17J80-10]
MQTDSQNALRRQEALIGALADRLRLATGAVARFETHISWILVANDHAWKIKKAVHFDFLDFSSLDARRFYCEEELRLNRRLAPTLYLDVQAITGSVDAPQLAGEGEPIEYALRMRAFTQASLWSERVAIGAITPDEIDQLAGNLAHFHQQAPAAPDGSAWGSPALLQSSANDILATLQASLTETVPASQVAKLSAWHADMHVQLRPVFERRRREGRVREGHGDLHCGNILTLHGHATAFDCIEFSEGLRWIDVLNDLAFATMDLQVLGQPRLAARLRDRYLEATGDYLDLDLLRYYQTLRALVRCKVYVLRLQELAADDPQRAACAQRVQAYLQFALACVQPARAALMITHGFSGSGKSTVAAAVVELCDAVRIRSDVERKRMHGIDAASPAGAAPASGLYAPAASMATYARLALLARRIIAAGWPVIVDAAFLERRQRDAFAALAKELGVPFMMLDVCAGEAILRERVVMRSRRGGDASDAGEAVLEHQRASHEPLSVEEMPYVTQVDSAAGDLVQTVRAAWERLR